MKTSNHKTSISIGDKFKDSRNQIWILKSFNTTTASLNSQKGGIKMIPINDLHYQINNNVLSHIESLHAIGHPPFVANKVCDCPSLDLFRYGCKCSPKN